MLAPRTARAGHERVLHSTSRKQNNATAQAVIKKAGTEFMRTGVPEVIVLEARAAFETLWASERKRETYYLVYIL